MIIKVTPDKEKVKSILQLTKEREDFVKTWANELNIFVNKDEKFL